MGRVVRTRDGVKPLYVSPGHRIGVDQAAALVLRLGAGYRLPEPVGLVSEYFRAAGYFTSNGYGTPKSRPGKNERLRKIRKRLVLNIRTRLLPCTVVSEQEWSPGRYGQGEYVTRTL